MQLKHSIENISQTHPITILQKLSIASQIKSKLFTKACNIPQCIHLLSSFHNLISLYSSLDFVLQE
jgi:hypothetical protein